MRLVPMLALVATAALAAAAVGLAFGTARHGDRRSPDERARATATEFFRALNAGRFVHVCRLLSRGYYERNKVRDRRECALGLRASSSYVESRFRITGVRATRDHATVSAVANGAAGVIELVRERGRYRVLSVDSA